MLNGDRIVKFGSYLHSLPRLTAKYMKCCVIAITAADGCLEKEVIWIRCSTLRTLQV